MLRMIRWVWKGSTVLDLGPDEPHDIALLKLSRGGADATVVREFNLVSKVLPASELCVGQAPHPPLHHHAGHCTRAILQDRLTHSHVTVCL